MTNVIEIDRVTKRYGRFTAVDDATLRVPAGCVFALLGENGAGKTTLVRMLLGLLSPDAGSISVFGRNSTTHGEEVRRLLGYVPERPTLYEWMTAAEIGWFTAGFYGDGFEQHYRNLLDRFRVPTSRKIGKMSKGMRAKVSLSLAMAHQPRLLVLDEPTSGLDTLVRREFLESMVDLAAEGHTVLLSSHLIGEVERVADQVAVVREGKILAVDPLDRLKLGAYEITATMHGSAAAPPPVPGTLLTSSRRGKQWRLLVRDVEDEGAIDRLADLDSVAVVDRRTPSLEEIFVAYMTENHPPSANGQPGVLQEV
ncbi:putative ABC transporter ATP-binding protein YxlF [Posidoniimonas polymericola]|uniref:Putative ABC transporter ATP-binding protein YxlF n=1 Tax=Posidoniimonas polymericola TaxID=2528002 RepID=A0A5C5YSV8_9BACT|nr:ABC transporter ATP-binding protein [Posidoniimonas polymericola]TWT78072.1 putative ABC transporter ATP-binding protein YxlF [Posidoniimonas polymericola]